MRYYKARIAVKDYLDLSGNLLTYVYFGVKDKLTDEMLDMFNWSILEISQIPSYEYAWHILTKPVTDYINCFYYAESVVIK